MHGSFFNEVVWHDWGEVEDQGEVVGYMNADANVCLSDREKESKESVRVYVMHGRWQWLSFFLNEMKRKLRVLSLS